jgi:septum formation protein
MLGLPFRVEAPDIDETVPAGTPPNHAVALLSEHKARVVASRCPAALVVGSDQMVVVDGRVLGKPRDAPAAKAQLEALRSRTHEIFTGVCVVGPGFLCTEVDTARLTVHSLSDEEVGWYVATGEWQGCAGGYRIEGRGQALFSRIEGCRTSVQGLPMQRLVRLLREAGVRFFE